MRNAQFWRRLALGGSMLWLSGVALASVLNGDFYWYRSGYTGAFLAGPATEVALVGVAIILAGCLIIPWIVAARER